jgi:methylmalonyl-CoA/ethylmalonyl-CoA epimerase
MMIRKIDHIAVAVKDIEAAIGVFRDRLGLSLAKTYESEYTQAHIAFFPIGETKIELLQPTSTSSLLTKFLEKRGEGIHHLCLGVEDIEATLAHLAGAGVELIDKRPRTTRDGRKIAFLNPRMTNGILIELVEMNQKEQNLVL